MKINRKRLIPKLALVSAAVCAAVLAFTPNANALNLTFSDQYVVGTISPGAPADPADVATYVNYMTGLSTGGSGTFSGQTITRSNNTFASLPNAVFNQNDPNAQGTTTSVNLGAGGLYTYLFAKYDGQNDNSLVWYVGNLSGMITIPQNGPLGHGLSGWILFGPGGGQGVPDGGTTVMLLGAALGALGMARRFLKI
jgi:VPDSG-CTERM motif